jgi:hypothetical protein
MIRTAAIGTTATTTMIDLVGDAAPTSELARVAQLYAKSTKVVAPAVATFRTLKHAYEPSRDKIVDRRVHDVDGELVCRDEVMAEHCLRT